jgi:Mce-associated membrane protein
VLGRSTKTTASSLPEEDDPLEAGAEHQTVNGADDIAMGASARNVPSSTDADSSDGESLPAAADDGGAPMHVYRMAINVGVAIMLALGALVGWLGFEVSRNDRAADQRAIFEQTARQGAIDLTTLDWRQADADVKRILDAATGSFHDDFASQSQPFIDAVKDSKSVTTGTVTGSGIESATNDTAQVMVAVSVRTSSAQAPESDPRTWRIRIAVQKVDNDVKVANVDFVP